MVRGGGVLYSLLRVLCSRGREEKLTCGRDGGVRVRRKGEDALLRRWSLF